MCQLYDLLSGAVRQRPAVDIDSTQLVDPAVACSRASKYRTSAYVVVFLFAGEQEEKRQKTKHSVTKSEGVANPLPATHPSTRSNCDFWVVISTREGQAASKQCLTL